MRISVNLATRPFVELRPLFAKLRLVAIGLALLAVVLGLTLRSLNAKARTAEAEMNAIKARTLSYQQERQGNEARMRQPQNMAVLERSQFLNALFAAKSFSWTAVMMDLERVLPAGVQVTSIEPATSKTGEVSIRLRVSGDRDRTVELVRNLEHSQRFINPRLAGEQTQAQETNGRASFQPAVQGAVEFDILSGYNPLAPETAKTSKSAAKEDATASDVTSDAAPLTAPRRARGAKAAPPKQRHLIGGAR
ncbi:MAG: PilN domain-containing protein [Acidobacteria bacterium]|nr:PilN domain-containing protein [Acidobacteriota bacterium]